VERAQVDTKGFYEQILQAGIYDYWRASLGGSRALGDIAATYYKILLSGTKEIKEKVKPAFEMLIAQAKSQHDTVDADNQKAVTANPYASSESLAAPHIKIDQELGDKLMETIITELDSAGVLLRRREGYAGEI